MIDIAACRAGLAANLLNVLGLQESPYLLSNPTPPCAEIEVGPIDYDQTMQRGEDDLHFTVRVYVSSTTDVGSQKLLDTFLAATGAQSIKTALESDKTLGGAVDTLHVSRCSGYRAFERGGQPAMLGAEWEVLVIAG